MARDSVWRTFLVAAVLCIVCSVLVSGAAVGLRPRQERNKALDRKKNILIAAGLYEPGADIEGLFAGVRSKLIDLATGKPVSPSEVDPASYDARQAARDPDQSVVIPPESDLAGIHRREKYAFVYLVEKQGQVEQYVLPIYGKGLWSTLYGFIAIDADANTIRGLTFYEHRETPGLGGEVDNPKWKELWPGKQLHDAQGQIQIEVLKGAVAPDSPAAIHQVDGISGATITCRGVSNLLRYWLGPDAFGPYLAQQSQHSTTR